MTRERSAADRNTALDCKQILTLFLKLDQEKLFVLFWFCNVSRDIGILQEKQYKWVAQSFENTVQPEALLHKS